MSRWKYSNFLPAEVELDGEVYPTTEHAYQAAKTLDHAARDYVRHAPSPGKAKRDGRRLTMRDDWDEVKVDVMEALLRQKFAPRTEHFDTLMADTDERIVEWNRWHDNFWGICQCRGRESCNGTGRNELGKLLMRIREDHQKMGYGN